MDVLYGGLGKGLKETDPADRQNSWISLRIAPEFLPRTSRGFFKKQDEAFTKTFGIYFPTNKRVYSVIFFQKIIHQILEPNRYSAKMLDPVQDSVNPDPQHWFIVYIRSD